jgi:hypothetical protein
MKNFLSSVVMVTAVLLTGAKAAPSKTTAPVPLEIVKSNLKCEGKDIQVNGVYLVTKQNKLLPGRGRNEKLRPGLMKEYEYKSARAEVHVKLQIEDGETIEFDAQPEGEGLPEEGTSPASGTLREEGAIVRLDREGSIDQFYLYADNNDNSEINITYKTEKDTISGKRTVRKSLTCNLEHLAN